MTDWKSHARRVAAAIERLGSDVTVTRPASQVEPIPGMVIGTPTPERTMTIKGVISKPSRDDFESMRESSATTRRTVKLAVGEFEPQVGDQITTGADDNYVVLAVETVKPDGVTAIYHSAEVKV